MGRIRKKIEKGWKDNRMKIGLKEILMKKEMWRGNKEREIIDREWEMKKVKMGLKSMESERRRVGDEIWERKRMWMKKMREKDIVEDRNEKFGERKLRDEGLNEGIKGRRLEKDLEIVEIEIENMNIVISGNILERWRKNKEEIGDIEGEWIDWSRKDMKEEEMNGRKWERRKEEKVVILIEKDWKKGRKVENKREGNLRSMDIMGELRWRIWEKFLERIKIEEEINERKNMDWGREKGDNDLKYK